MEERNGYQVSTRSRANDLTGREWLRNSISVWPIAKSGGDKAFGHPAIFPEQLVERLLRCYLSGSNKRVLDPFMGIGTTLLSACKQGHFGIGFEVYDDFVQTAMERLDDFEDAYRVFPNDALKICEFVDVGSVDMVITSPPYWNILTRRRTADYRPIVNYGGSEQDIGNISDYSEFVQSFSQIMQEVYHTLKEGAYCVVNVMDLRVKNKFYMLHSDVCTELESIGYELDDIIIWDRRADYNRLRPLGYPSKFRINRVHEYLLIFQKEA